MRNTSLGILSFARSKGKAVIYAFVLVAMTLSLSLVPASSGTAQAASCFQGAGYGKEWRDGEWHNYVLFLVGSSNNGHPNWRVYPPSNSGIWRWSLFGPPQYGGLKVGYRWRYIPNPVPAWYWLACKA